MDNQAQTPAQPQTTAPAAPVAPATGVCDSCGANTVLHETPHHQEGNEKIWKYCKKCKELSEKEVKVLASLKQLMNTHPNEANRPDVAGMFHQGKTLEEVKKTLDTTKQPELEAEVA